MPNWDLQDGDGLIDTSHQFKPFIFCETDGWATVLTPAPQAAPEGLQEGDAVECGPAMRAAIVELAKELGIHGGWDLEEYPAKEGICLYWNGKKVHTGRFTSNHTPEAFIAKMRVEAAKPKPIRIDGHEVQFSTGSIKVGCTTINNETVRAIAAKLID